MRGKAAGTQRERAVRDYYRDRDWLAFRAPASLGVADVIALKAGHRPQLVEVKSTAQGPYESFGPSARARLSFAAEMAGADAVVAWWPKGGKMRLINEWEWPNARRGLSPELEEHLIDEFTRPYEPGRKPVFACVVDKSASQHKETP